MSDYDKLVNMIEDLETNYKIDMDKAEYIYTAYPGAFYRKRFDNGKMKVFTRGTSTKAYIYPDFKPRSPKSMNNIYVGCVGQSYRFLELSNNCWSEMDNCLENSNECQSMSNECRQISVDFFNKSNECFKHINNTS